MSSDALRSDPGRRRLSAARAAATALALLLGAPLFAATPTEEDLFRQVKVDVFDQNWSAVLRGCEEILRRDPSGASATQAGFYRARALTQLPGREGEGLEAFRVFIASHPHDAMMVEEAWAAVFSSACGPRRASKSTCLSVLNDGLSSDSGYVTTLAAIRASDTSDETLRRRALVTLKKAYGTQTDSEIRNEILLAILKIDPKEVPSSESARPISPSGAQRRPGAGKAPSLIRMTVYNKPEKRYELKVNLPIGFARLLIGALEQDQKKEMQREAQQQGIDLDDIFEAIEKAGAGKLLEVDDESSRIEIWIE